MPSQGPECYSNHAEANKHGKNKAHAVLASSSGKGGWKDFDFEERAFKANRAMLPKFKVTMQPSYVTERSMAMPVKFSKKYLKMDEAPVYLNVLGEESTWQVKYKKWTTGYNSTTKYKLQDGWNKFVSMNHLKVGDSLEFIWTNSNPLKFKVDIGRALVAKNPCSTKNPYSKSIGKTCSDSHGKFHIDSNVLVDKFLVSHEDMKLSLQQFPEQMSQFLYSCLAELIKMLKSFQICDQKQKLKDSIFSHLETFRCVSLSHHWLDEVEAFFNQPLPHTLQALTDMEV
ncbi:hypothetical protein RIF29_15147 [Crotalaria pallida]|uniref:TF-B3 domain-containing protein n=1 Tax=Crotalaria pallida TaxID=3830 RepID=A0AAN9IIY8_CROPI